MDAILTPFLIHNITDNGFFAVTLADSDSNHPANFNENFLMSLLDWEIIVMCLKDPDMAIGRIRQCERSFIHRVLARLLQQFEVY
jgi:hypothetical protein